ncbi:MAG: Gfo/Idh/MocA family oxidoreductase, partial [Anaerolineaceae bacterium]
MKQQVRICMIGAGRVGKNHSRALSRHIAAAKIVALVDPMAEVRNETAKDFGIDQQFDTLEMALENAQFDAVIITTPTPTHLPLTQLAANHKKHIFLEKPMALNLEECDEIIKVVEKNKVILQLGFMRRFDPEFVAAAQRIEAGEIGTPMMVKSNTHGPGVN